MNELNPTEILKYNMYDNNILLHNVQWYLFTREDEIDASSNAP